MVCTNRPAWHATRPLRTLTDEAGIFSDHSGKLVLNGAMGGAEEKRLPDGSTVELRRFILKLAPMNVHFRALANDTPSCIHRFRLACGRLKLHLHAGQRVVMASSALILRAELAMHGTKGRPGSSPCCRSWVFLGGPLQHCVCVALYTFAAGFRRPLFFVFQEGFIQEPKRRACSEVGFGG